MVHIFVFNNLLFLL